MRNAWSRLWAIGFASHTSCTSPSRAPAAYAVKKHCLICASTKALAKNSKLPCHVDGDNSRTAKSFCVCDRRFPARARFARGFRTLVRAALDDELSTGENCDLALLTVKSVEISAEGEQAVHVMQLSRYVPGAYMARARRF
eukprot:c56196_g1_i1.p2 GENE.c56196_g1_i1~~c56196_g1_i1.p2  ORF type:complete len:141 (+),score=5.25 c56196_g1_i1:160-582(+)